MDITQIKQYIQENKLINRELIATKTAKDIDTLVNEQRNNKGTVDISDPQTLTHILTKAISNAISLTLEETIPAVGSALSSQIKVDMKQEIVDETKAHIDSQCKQITRAVTEKLVKCKYDMDKIEAYDRMFNLNIGGIEEDPEERKYHRITRDKVVSILSDMGCKITKDDMSACYRIYRSDMCDGTTYQIKCRFISKPKRDEILGFKVAFAASRPGRYMKEDMTFLQEKLYLYLKKKEDIVIKASVNFQKLRVCCLLKKNEHSKQWSRVDSVFDLGKMDNELIVNLDDLESLKQLGLEDCHIDICDSTTSSNPNFTRAAAPFHRTISPASTVTSLSDIVSPSRLLNTSTSSQSTTSHSTHQPDRFYPSYLA